MLQPGLRRKTTPPIKTQELIPSLQLINECLLDSDAVEE